MSITAILFHSNRQRLNASILKLCYAKSAGDIVIMACVGNSLFCTGLPFANSKWAHRCNIKLFHQFELVCFSFPSF